LSFISSKITSNTEELLFVILSFMNYFTYWKRGYCTVPYNIEENTWERKLARYLKKEDISDLFN